jgi:hypothetical protein
VFRIAFPVQAKHDHAVFAMVVFFVSSGRAETGEVTQQIQMEEK